MDRWPLVGRVEEQAFVAAALADRTRCGALVAGAAGVGKTRLMREVIGALSDWRVEHVTATESARTLPFGATAHLLPEDLASIERVDLLAVIGRHLVHRAEGRPLLVAVDDVHLLDNLSAALVHHLATTHTSSVLLTLRSGEAAPDAVTALRRDDLLSRLELQPISRAEFGELIEGVLCGMVEQASLDRMWGVTEGNVLFARELLDDALEAGTLRMHHRVWRWLGGLGVAPRLRETVAGRLGALEPAQRHLLELLAVGEPLLFSRAVTLAPDISLPDLERRGLVTTEAADHGAIVRLAHPLFGEALRAAMPLSLHRQLSLELSRSLSAEGELPGDAIKLALLREAAGEVVEPALLTEAARNANALSDGKLAERLARASVDATDHFDARFELGRALLIQNRFEESSRELLPLVGVAPDDDDRERLADALATAVFHGLGRVDEALGIVARIEAGVTDPAILALLQCHRATLLAFGGRFSEAAELGARALDRVNDDATRVRSLANVGVSLVMAGRIDEALALNDGTLEAAFRLRDRLPRAPAWVIASRCTALFLAGRSDEALATLDLGERAANLSTTTTAQASTYRARYLLAQGRVRTASRLLNDALLTLRENPVPEPSWGLALAAEAYALLGQHKEARAAAAESVSLRRPGLVAFEVDEWRALAWVDAQDGRTSSAITQLRAAADLAATRGQRSLEMIILHDLLRLGEHRAARRAQDVAEQVDGAWAAAIAAHAEAVLSADTAALTAAAHAFEAISSFMVAAELWASVASRHESEGLRAKASQTTRRSAEMAERCEGARTHPLGWAADPVPLSRREREIVTLAAQGATNAQIAADLSVSVRTVETHLYHAFAKLGVAERSQLSDALSS